MLRLAIRTLPVFAVIIGFAMFLAAYMNFSGVRSAYLDLIRSRMAMTADRIANDISTAHALGIRLTEQTTLPDLLAREAASDPLTLSIDVSADDGTIVFSSDADRAGVLDAPGKDEEAFRYDHNIVNDFGAPVGSVHMRLDRHAIDGAVEGLRLDVLKGAVPAGIGAVVAGSLVCMMLFGMLHRRARRSAEGRAQDDPIGRAAAEIERLRPEARA